MHNSSPLSSNIHLLSSFLPLTSNPLPVIQMFFPVPLKDNLLSSGTVGAMMGLMKSKFLPAAPLKTKVHSDLAPSVDMVCLHSYINSW